MAIRYYINRKAMNVFYFPPKNSICYENGHKNTVYRKNTK